MQEKDNNVYLPKIVEEIGAGPQGATFKEIIKWVRAADGYREGEIIYHDKDHKEVKYDRDPTTPPSIFLKDWTPEQMLKEYNGYIQSSSGRFIVPDFAAYIKYTNLAEGSASVFSKFVREHLEKSISPPPYIPDCSGNKQYVFNSIARKYEKNITNDFVQNTIIEKLITATKIQKELITDEINFSEFDEFYGLNKIQDFLESLIRHPYFYILAWKNDFGWEYKVGKTTTDRGNRIKQYIDKESTRWGNIWLIPYIPGKANVDAIEDRYKKEHCGSLQDAEGKKIPDRDRGRKKLYHLLDDLERHIKLGSLGRSDEMHSINVFYYDSNTKSLKESTLSFSHFIEQFKKNKSFEID